MSNYTVDLSQFPITSELNNIISSLKLSPTHFLILTAETAAGKSTILPIGLLEDEMFSKGHIIMTEPRRLAVLGVANRVSEVIGEECVESVGYKIHLDKKISSKTRLEIVTEAILVRQLQNDPSLENYNLVVLDEFHERSVNTDLALAFLKEAMELRDDLYVVIMSATMDVDKLQQYLGNDTPIIKVPGRQYPVDVIYENNKEIEKVIIDELDNKDDGNILVFLPGISDIRRVQNNLLSEYSSYFSSNNIELCILHSSITLNEQKKILKESDKRRVILSSAIAETSLTVPGITSVIDSGLCRVNRINASNGMEGLFTETESEFSAEQRKGRAGRLQEGRCIRMWSKADPRIKNMPCEILRADLSSLVLECSDRGIYDVSNIDWLDCPSRSSYETSKELLINLNLLNKNGHITEKGKASLSLGLHPRLASLALDNFNKAKHLIIKYSSYCKSDSSIQNKFLNDLENRVKRENYKSEVKVDEDLVILSGYPDRLCKKISKVGEKPCVYQLPSGRKAILGDNKEGSDWICAPSIIIGAKDTVIFDFERLETAKVEEWLKERIEIREVCVFENGKIKKSENTYFGKIIISSKKLVADTKDLGKAWCNEIKEKGIDVVPQNKEIKSLITRSLFLWENNGFIEQKKKYDNLFDFLINNCEEWLIPFLGNSKTLTEKIVYDALYWYLDGRNIDEKVPEIFILDNNRRVKVKYEKLQCPSDKNKLIIRPVIEVIIQRIFGCFETPKINGVKVLLRLLSPSQRPLQITDDLEGFWSGAWIEICKEMKGRYTKHNWDEKICTEKE